MPEVVYRMMTLLCPLVVSQPVGTNLGLLHLLWMLVSGQLLAARGAVMPGLSACGLSERAVRRPWAALGQGEWASVELLTRWRALVRAEGHWRPHTHGGYHPVAVDVTAFWQPRLRECREPLLLASPLSVTAPVLWTLYRDRRPVEQLPLAAKQMLGAARAFVHAPETCQRLPARALLAGAILSYGAATSPALPTGFWDRCPQPTPGRLRRALARCPFPHNFPLPARIREKAAHTAHLPTGFWGQRRRHATVPAVTAAQPRPTPLDAAA